MDKNYKLTVFVTLVIRTLKGKSKISGYCRSN